MQSSSSYPFATQKGYTTAAVSRVSLFAFFGNNHRTLRETVRVRLESELLEAAIASHLETSSHRKQPWDKSDTNPKIPQHLNMHKQMSPEKKLSRSLIGRMFSAQKNSLRQHISVREKILFWFPQKYFQSFFFSSRREMARIWGETAARMNKHLTIIIKRMEQKMWHPTLKWRRNLAGPSFHKLFYFSSNCESFFFLPLSIISLQPSYYYSKRWIRGCS